MDWHFTPAAAPLIVGAALMLGIFELVRRRKPARGGALRFVALGVFVYVVGYALELGSSTPELVLRWLKIQYLGITTVPVLAFVVALAFTGRERYLTPLALGLLFAIPATTCLLAWTNESHEFIWREIHIDTSLGFTRTTFVRGPWYAVHNTYVHVLLALTILLLAQAIRRTAGLFRRQLVVLLLASIVPIVIHAIYLSTSFFAGLDPNPYAFIVTAVTLTWGMLESALMELVPVAQEAVFASLGDPVVVTDTHDRVVAMNPAAQAVLGVASATALGKTASDVFPSWSTLLGGRPVEETFRVPLALTSGGLERFFEASITPLSPRAGHVEGRLVVLQDMTERRQVEKLREDLVSTLVHDLRNPLTVIRASVDLLAIDDDASLRLKELMEPARLATRRLLDLVSRLLEVHTLQSGHFGLERSRVEIASLIAEAVEMQAPLARAKGQRLVVDAAAELPVLLADRELIGRVLQNLIGNAIKFTGAGEIRIRASLAAGPSVAVRVSDDGPGIPREIRDRLFREFVRGNVVARGSGLGLAFCRSATLAHGGSITADSDPGRGTAIEFRLPLTPPS